MLVIALEGRPCFRLGGGLFAARGSLGADFILGGSGHNAGVINPPAANKHGFWTKRGEARERRGLAGERHPPRRQLVADTGPNGWPARAPARPVAARAIADGHRARARQLRDDAVMDMATTVKPTC